MHSVKVEAHRRYASISPKAELKAHVSLNVGRQRGCKVVTSGTSVNINVFFSRRVYDLYSFVGSGLRLSDTSTTSKDLYWDIDIGLSHPWRINQGNDVHRRAAEELLQREKDVFSRQLSIHFGSMSFLPIGRTAH